jgi:hypothetical protein
LNADSPGDRWGWLHKALGVVSGATGGFTGVAGLLWDLPITTTLIMRSVGDIARSFPSEDINSDETRRACVEVFALGSPLDEDDTIEFGYWTASASLSKIVNELFTKNVASRLAAVVSEKLLAQAVPVAGAAAGAALNYAFIDYYQEMARVHFMIRGVERRAADPSAVQPCFSAIVGSTRSRRKSGSKRAA